MDFDKIRCDGTNVELDYTQSTNGTTSTVQEKGKDPTTALKAALQAFAGYANWVLSGPESWDPSIAVRAVTIKRDEDEPRGIVVTILKTCQRARNATATINTPFLTEKPVGGTGAGHGFLPEHVPTLIDALEEAAEAYHAGERGDQIALGLSDNSKQASERMAAASAGATRKPKTSKKKDADYTVLGTDPVLNPDSNAVLTDDQVRQLLLTVERDIPADAIPTWTSSERAAAIAWGRARQRELVGSLKPDEKMPAEPPVLLRSATPALKAEEWTSAVPPLARNLKSRVSSNSLGDIR